METFILSSDSEDDGPAAKKRSIDGIPNSFSGDTKMRFSFGVSNISMSINTEAIGGNVISGEHDDMPITKANYSSPPRVPRNIFAKTPTSLRRRSVSMSFKSHVLEKINEPPMHQSCSSFIQMQQLNALSGDEDQNDWNSTDNDLNLRALLSPEKKKRKEKEVQNEFYGVYCLISRSERPCYKNRCYIGYTVDPNRRIMQHNGGRYKGGAKKTDSRGPWDMVCVIHGFPNHVSALRFEWAWQNPSVSKSLREKQLKKDRKETPFAFQLRIACELMNSHAFRRFALTFRWLITTEELPFPTSCIPPSHTKLRYGKVKKEMSIVPSKRDAYVVMGECKICRRGIEKLWGFVRCLATSCSSHFHTKCLAENGLRRNNEYMEHVFPLNVHCPVCGQLYLWGDIIREQRRIIKVSTKCVEQFRNMVVRQDFPHREISTFPKNN